MSEENQRGHASLELVLITPLVIAVLLVTLILWRVSTAKYEVRAAAAAGARAASLARSGQDAQSQAENAVLRSLENSQVPCTPEIEVDSSAFASPIGTAGEVSVTVSCKIGLSDLAFPGFPGQVVANYSAIQPLDTFRERRP